MKIEYSGHHSSPMLDIGILKSIPTIDQKLFTPLRANREVFPKAKWMFSDKVFHLLGIQRDIPLFSQAKKHSLSSSSSTSRKNCGFESYAIEFIVVV